MGLPLLEELEEERNGPGARGGGGRPDRPFSVLSLASKERVRGRPQGGCREQGLVLELLSLSEGML